MTPYHGPRPRTVRRLFLRGLSVAGIAELYGMDQVTIDKRLRLGIEAFEIRRNLVNAQSPNNRPR